jgi:hypothetical protein
VVRRVASCAGERIPFREGDILDGDFLTGELPSQLEPNEDAVCMVVEEVPDLEGIARASVGVSEGI